MLGVIVLAGLSGAVLALLAAPGLAWWYALRCAAELRACRAHAAVIEMEAGQVVATAIGLRKALDYVPPGFGS